MRGFTLPEIMVALSLLTVTAAGSAHLLAHTLNTWQTINPLYQGEAELAEWVATLSQHTPASGYLPSGRKYRIILESYGIRWSVEPHPDFPEWLPAENGWSRRY